MIVNWLAVHQHHGTFTYDVARLHEKHSCAFRYVVVAPNTLLSGDNYNMSISLEATAASDPAKCPFIVNITSGDFVIDVTQRSLPVGKCLAETNDWLQSFNVAFCPIYVHDFTLFLSYRADVHSELADQGNTYSRHV
jgi:hypothetical protein